MRGGLKRRIERLERNIGHRNLGWIVVLLSTDRQPGPGERLVIDWLSADNGMVILTQRITPDPNDSGKHCTPILDGWARWYFEPVEEMLQSVEGWMLENVFDLLSVPKRASMDSERD